MLNKNDLYRSFQNIDDDILERSEGITKKSRKNIWKKLAAMAVCLGLIILIGIMAIYMDEYLENREKPVYVDKNSTYGIIRELEKRYNKTATATDWKYDLSDEDIPLYEKCVIVEFNNKKYHTQSSSFVARIDESLLGEKIGICKAKSDYYTYMDKTLSVREICNVSPDLMIAVELEGRSYVFRNKLYGVSTLEEMFEVYGLLQVLKLNRFEWDDKYYTLEEDDAIWEMLSACSEAKFVWGSLENKSETICFEATSEALGIYKNEFSVSADGYVSTNMFTHEGAFFIGEEAAKEIISYAKENSKKAGYEPYIYQLAGKLLEVGDNYILMDDSVMCKKSDDGMTFRIEIDNEWFHRYFESGYIEIGDLIIVKFSGELDAETGEIELGPAFSIRPAKIVAEESDGFLDFIKEKYRQYKQKRYWDEKYKEYLKWRQGLAD